MSTHTPPCPVHARTPQVLSDGVFESKFCMEELASAVNAGVEIVLITKEGSRWPNRNGDMVEVFPPPELIEALEPPACRAAFARRAITHTNEYYAAFSHNLMQTVDKLIKEHRHQHGNPQEGQDTPDRLVLTQRRQLLRARSQSATHSKGPSAKAAVAVVESAASSPVSLVDVERLEEAIDDLGDDPKLDPRMVAAAKRKLERARAQSKYTLNEKLDAAREGTACEFQFMRANVLLARDYKSAPKHKSEEEDPELYTMLYLSSAECCQHKFRDKVLAVSHRWDRPEEPDPSGAQMKATKRVLRANPNIEYVWLVRTRALFVHSPCGSHPKWPIPLSSKCMHSWLMPSAHAFSACNRFQRPIPNGPFHSSDRTCMS